MHSDIPVRIKERYSWLKERLEVIAVTNFRGERYEARDYLKPNPKDAERVYVYTRLRDMLHSRIQEGLRHGIG